MKFDKNYFIGGEISAYGDYTLKEYDALADDLVEAIGIKHGDHVLDFGCATGILVKALRDKSRHCVLGTDISFWAINHGRKQHGLDRRILQHYNRDLLEQGGQYILFLDVLEHIPSDELDAIFSLISYEAIIVRVPISKKENHRYVLDIHEKDITHIQKHTKKWWKAFFNRYGFIIHKILDTETIFDSEGVLARVYKRR